MPITSPTLTALNVHTQGEFHAVLRKIMDTVDAKDALISSGLLAGCGGKTRTLNTDIFPRDVAEESHVIPGYVRHWEGIVASRERCAAMADRRARG